MGRTYEDNWIDRSHEFAVRVLRIAGKLPRTAVIARKEAAETRRALLVVRDVPLLPNSEGDELTHLIRESGELVTMLTAGTKRLQARIAKKKRRSPSEKYSP